MSGREGVNGWVGEIEGEGWEDWGGGEGIASGVTVSEEGGC